MAWRCAICLLVLTLTLKDLLSHINRSHSQDPSFHVVCSINGCPTTFRKYNSFYRHVIRNHPAEYNYDPRQNNPRQNADEDDQIRIAAQVDDFEQVRNKCL